MSLNSLRVNLCIPSPLPRLQPPTGPVPSEAEKVTEMVSSLMTTPLPRAVASTRFDVKQGDISQEGQEVAFSYDPNYFFRAAELLQALTLLE